MAGSKNGGKISKEILCHSRLSGVNKRSDSGPAYRQAGKAE